MASVFQSSRWATLVLSLRSCVMRSNQIPICLIETVLWAKRRFLFRPYVFLRYSVDGNAPAFRIYRRPRRCRLPRTIALRNAFSSASKPGVARKDGQVVKRRLDRLAVCKQIVAERGKGAVPDDSPASRPPSSPYGTAYQAPLKEKRGFAPYSHSMVPVGLGVRSYSTRLTPLTSVTIRWVICCNSAKGTSSTVAVIASRVLTARKITGQS